MTLTFPRSFKPHKTVVVLGVATAIGLLAALAARNFLQNRVAALEAQAHGQTVELLVADADLPRGTVLSSDKMAVRAIPLEYAHAAGIRPADFDQVSGQRLAYEVKKGQLVLWGLLETKRSPTFSARVDVGRRAMTVPVDEINSISGMLEPGDLIDLMVTVEQQGAKSTFPLLQRVQVLATGQRSVDDPKSGERREYATVTLSATPEQAQSVIMAREGGHITALLRNPQDQQPMADAALDMRALWGSRLRHGRAASASGDDGDPAEGIPVLYGGTSAKFTPEQLSMASARRFAASAHSATAPASAPPDPVSASTGKAAAPSEKASSAAVPGTPASSGAVQARASLP